MLAITSAIVKITTVMITVTLEKLVKKTVLVPILALREYFEELPLLRLEKYPHLEGDEVLVKTLEAEDSLDYGKTLLRGPGD